MYLALIMIHVKLQQHILDQTDIIYIFSFIKIVSPILLLLCIDQLGPI